MARAVANQGWGPWPDDPACDRCGSRLAIGDSGEPSEHACCRCLDGGRYRNGSGLTVVCPCRANVREPFDPSRSGIPAKLANVRIEDWQPANGEPRRFAEQFVSTWPPPFSQLVFVGHPGSGKTHLACAIIREVYESHGKRGRLTTSPAMLDRLKATFADDTIESTEDVMREYTGVPLLAIDDIGTEKGTEWASEKLFRILDARYGELRPTIVTANVDGFRGLHPRMRSRLADQRIGRNTEMPTGDRRIGGVA